MKTISNARSRRYKACLPALAGLTLFVALPGSPGAQEMDPEATSLKGPAPPVVEPEGLGHRSVPSDAIILFDGTSTDEWEQANDGGPVQWRLEDGVLTVKPGTGDIRTKRKFGDVQLHIEWRAPRHSAGSGQSWGNSGVFLQERYEVQILNSHDNPTYVNGQAGAIYKQHVPLVNASRSPGAWQSYDIIYQAPRFNDEGSLAIPARITVFHNGVLIQNNVSIWGPVVYAGLPQYKAHGEAPLRLQNHSMLQRDPSGSEVSFRNIWIREL